MKSWLSAEADSENGSRQGNIELSALRTKLNKFSSKIFHSVTFHTLINGCSKIFFLICSKEMLIYSRIVDVFSPVTAGKIYKEEQSTCNKIMLHKQYM